MLHFKRFLLIIFILIFHLSNAVDRVDVSTFRNYTSDQGLSCNYVHSFTQDSKGFLWVATELGLNRFDGINFKHYLLDKYPSMFRNDILHLSILPDGRVALGGNNGLVLAYNEDTDDFEDLKPSEFDSSYYKGITGFYKTNEDSLIISTSGGIYFWNAALNRFDGNSAVSDSSQSIYLTAVYEDKFARFWLAAGDDLVLLDSIGKRCFLKYDLKQFDATINGFIEINDSTFFVISSEGCFWEVVLDSNGDISSCKKEQMPFKEVTSWIKVDEGEYWYGTSSYGLWKCTCIEGKYVYTKMIVPNREPDSLRKIHTLFKDKYGNIWIGTQNSGIWRYGNSYGPGSLHSLELGFPEVDVTSFVQLEDGLVAVASDGHGIFVVDSMFHLRKRFEVAQGLTSNNVLSMSKSSNGFFWVVFWGGETCLVNPLADEVIKVDYEGISDPIYTTKAVKEFSNGEVWVGTAGDGVYARDLNGKWKRLILSDDNQFKRRDLWVEDFGESKQGIRWVITSRTVWRIEKDKITPVYPDVELIQSQRLFLMYQAECDDEGNLYVVTTQGILRFQADGKSYEWLDFLPKGSYVSILRDAYGAFWVSGSNGILSFDPKLKSYKNVILSGREGRNNYYTCRSSFMDNDGLISFGGSDGFIVFDPALVQDVQHIANLTLADLYIHGKKIKPYSDILPKPLRMMKELELEHDETNIVIEVDMVDFVGLNSVQILYKLSGVNKDWVDLGTQRQISFSHIPSGKHVLEIVSKRAGVVCDEHKIILPIEVSPPWWTSFWFQLLIIVVSILISWWFIYSYLKRVERQRKLLQQRVKERTKELGEINLLLESKQKLLAQRNEDLEQALEEKDLLISLIAHDLKNPMFAIVGALDTVLRRKGSLEDCRSTLKDIHSSAFYLQTVLVRILDWIKGRSSKIDCTLEDVDIGDVVRDVMVLFRSLLERKSITVNFESNIENYAIVDLRMAESIVRNLLSNAIKYSSEGGHIDITVSQDGDCVKLSVRDYGVGMSADTINNLLNEDKHKSTLGTNNEHGSGLGFQIVKEFVAKSNGKLRILSAVGEGSEIEISFVKSQNIIKKNETQELSLSYVNYSLDKETYAGSVVLLVDDDQLTLDYVKSLLIPYVQVKVASNGVEALDMAFKIDPDIIVSDVDMPMMDGIQLLKEVRSVPTLKMIPFIFLSAKDEDKVRFMGLSNGALDYLTKPFKEEELIMKLFNLLAFKRKQQQQYLLNSLKDEVVVEEMDPLLKKLMLFISENYSNSELSLDEIASEMLMSKSTLSRRLKSIMDKTPIEILVEYRLYKARDLLKNSKDTISEIAQSVGFNDPLYFSKKYKAFFGYSPSENR